MPKLAKPEMGFSSRICQFFQRSVIGADLQWIVWSMEHCKLPHCQWGPWRIPSHSRFVVQKMHSVTQNLVKYLRSFACKLLWGMWLDESQSKNIERSRLRPHKVGTYAVCSRPFLSEFRPRLWILFLSKMLNFVMIHFSSKMNLFSL